MGCDGTDSYLSFAVYLRRILVFHLCTVSSAQYSFLARSDSIYYLSSHISELCGTLIIEKSLNFVKAYSVLYFLKCIIVVILAVSFFQIVMAYLR